MPRLFLLFILLPSFAFSTVHFGGDIHYFSLKERDGGSQVKGLLKGAIVELDCFGKKGGYLGLRTLIGAGSLPGLNYYGLSTNHFILEKTIEGRVGCCFSLGNNIGTLYSGLSYYYLDDQWKEANALMQYRTFSIPLGVSFERSFLLGGLLKFVFQWDGIFSGFWRIEGHPVFTSTSHPLKKSGFCTIEIPISYWICGINFKVVPWGRWGVFHSTKEEESLFNTMNLLSAGGRFEMGLVY